MFDTGSLHASWSVRIFPTLENFTTSTDVNGRFEFNEVPVGRHVIQVSFMGYESRVIEGVVLNSGRPAVLEVSMNESVVAIEGALRLRQRRKAR